jgi:hypothetical protein
LFLIEYTISEKSLPRNEKKLKIYKDEKNFNNNNNIKKEHILPSAENDEKNLIHNYKQIKQKYKQPHSPLQPLPSSLNSSHEVPKHNPSPPPPSQKKLNFNSPPPLLPKEIKNFSLPSSSPKIQSFAYISDSSLFAVSKHIDDHEESTTEYENESPPPSPSQISKLIQENKYSKTCLDESLKKHTKSEDQLLNAIIEQEKMDILSKEHKKYNGGEENKLGEKMIMIPKMSLFVQKIFHHKLKFQKLL